MAKGANKEEFGNGRLVENVLEDCIRKQKTRIGTKLFRKECVTEKEYRLLTRSDTIGDRPRLESSSGWAELMSLVGLSKVKEQMKSFMNLQLRNYDNEVSNKKTQTISLHRIFMGNPGCGKTRVARIYGKLLKEFGYLSDGDLIEVSPADLLGQSQGEAAVCVKNLL